MSTILAIKGHPTRGNEIITLLERMGGYADALIDNGTDEKYAYLIIKDENNAIDAFPIDKKDEFDFDARIFTLEEFLEKYPFKVGDKVIDEADGCPGVVCEMKWDEGLSDMKYCVAFGNGIVEWYANGSIDFFRNNGNLEENKFPSFEPMFKINGEIEYKIPDGYEITEVSKNKVFIKPIKSKYPTEYEECVRIAKNIHGYDIHVDVPAYGELMESFVKLLICRDAYWKIAGEEMGLGKPWKPQFEALVGNTFFTIQTFNGEIDKSATSHRNSILAFPTIAIRDAFYENFKDLIEQCKELL